LREKKDGRPTHSNQSYLDILLFDEKEVQEKIKDAEPVARVFITRLEPSQRFFDNETRIIPVLESVNYTEVVIKEKLVYDLWDLERAMCVTMGRFSHNNLRPFLNDDAIDMDPFVSREHGLIFLNEKRRLCYHDIGTFKKGSTNGTKLNDISVVKNEITRWEEDEYFGLGETLNVFKEGARITESKFKLRYELLD
jgi:pSer/pThr/pTyr-binding forkhead associated (FHA) protein